MKSVAVSTRRASIRQYLVGSLRLEDRNLGSVVHRVRYSWVNQNQTYRHELRGGYLWFPERKASQALNSFDDFMREVAPGDVIFSFANTRIGAVGIARSHAYEPPKPLEFGQAGAYWDLIAWRLDVAFTELKH